MQLAGHFMGPTESSAVRYCRWLGTVASVLAALFLINGLWQLAQLSMGPVVTPLVAAALAAGLAAGLSFYARRRALQERRHARSPNPLLNPRLMLAGLELWLTPRSLRRTVFSGLVLNFINRTFFK